MLFLMKVWLWLKKYWYVPLLFIAGIVGLIVSLLVFRKPTFFASDILKKQRKIYQEEKEQLEKVEQEKKEKKEEIKKEYEETIERLEKKYEVKKEVLNRRKKKKVKKIIEKHKNNKAELHKKLSSEFGIVYVEK